MTLEVAQIEYPLATLELEQRESGGGGVSWVRAMVLGELHHQRRDRETGEITTHVTDITIAYIEEVATATRAAIFAFEEYAREHGGTPYRFPVRLVHEDLGKTYGDILDTKVAPDSTGEPALFVKVAWRAMTWDAIQAEQVKYVSPGIARDYIDGRGKSYGRALVELSLTDSPRQEWIGTIQDTIALELARGENTSQSPDDSTTGDDMTPEEIEQLLERLAMIEQRLDALELEPEPVEAMTDEEEEVAAAAADEDDESITASAVRDIIRAELGELTAELRASRLNTSERGTPGNPTTEPRTESEWREHGRSKGLRGLALAEYVNNNV